MREEGSLFAISTVHAGLVEELRGACKAVPKLAEIMQQLRDGLVTKPGYSMQGDLLMYRGRILIPPGSTMIGKVLGEFHDSSVGDTGGPNGP